MEKAGEIVVFRYFGQILAEKFMIWRWLQPEDGTQILTQDRNWPMLGFRGR